MGWAPAFAGTTLGSTGLLYFAAMSTSQANNPLHGITLQQILEFLVAHYGWEELGQRIAIRCFTHDPSIPSSLKFLRRTPWARQKVEELYIRAHR